MLKTRIVSLAGRDEGRQVMLMELPALAADRYARAALRRVDADQAGGVVALAMRNQKDVVALGEEGQALLAPFLRATSAWGETFTLDDLKDWRNVARLQQAALLLHVDFLVGRQLSEVPVAMRAEQIISGAADFAATFCSPFLAAVLQSGKATYVELETVLSTEDAFNLVELLNIDAIREWHAAQTPNKG
jgi:hypothetical protein